ncbi:hypothetical protein Patl1_18375 [Pistacia atlantica]|uniref:Uncharacterized protein n=1 Tax=Pistacia atlantica TaxID=434234 RepID=A0ACC1C2Z6_9ROSI|nr:hypothetical protein Patl1_18375 [Pistacia atlantica]
MHCDLLKSYSQLWEILKLALLITSLNQNMNYNHKIINMRQLMKPWPLRIHKPNNNSSTTSTTTTTVSATIAT